MDYCNAPFLSELCDISPFELDDLSFCPEFTDDVFSDSSCGSPAKEMLECPDIHVKQGSICSSSYEDDSDVNDPFEFCDMGKPPLDGEVNFTAAELGMLFAVRREDATAQIYNDAIVSAKESFGSESMEFENRDYMLSFQDLPLEQSETSVESHELLKVLMEKTGELCRERQIYFLPKSDATCQELTLAQQAVLDASSIIMNSNIRNSNSNNLTFFDSIMNQNQRLQTELNESRFEVKIKQEEVDNANENRKQTHAKSSSTIPKLKRKKRKYERRATARKSIQLYEFMLELLDKEDDSVTWVSREDGVFKLLKSKGVAAMWGKYKKNENMTYESLSRALRHYYAQEILVPVPKKLHYKFCKKTLDNWYKSNKSG